jgi:tetratricopeptide (TPR) repeat protein
LVIDRHADHAAVAEAWLGLGRIQRLQKQPDKALEALAKALATAQGVVGAEAQFELAAAHRDKDDAKTAAEEFLKVAILYGDARWSARAQFEAGQCYEQLQDKDAAIKSYKVIGRDYPQQQQWVDQAAARLKALEQ